MPLVFRTILEGIKAAMGAPRCAEGAWERGGALRTLARGVEGGATRLVRSSPPRTRPPYHPAVARLRATTHAPVYPAGAPSMRRPLDLPLAVTYVIYGYTDLSIFLSPVLFAILFCMLSSVRLLIPAGLNILCGITAAVCLCYALAEAIYVSAIAPVIMLALVFALRHS